jgi:hypothetical protein
MARQRATHGPDPGPGSRPRRCDGTSQVHAIARGDRWHSSRKEVSFVPSKEHELLAERLGWPLHVAGYRAQVRTPLGCSMASAFA